MSSSPLIPASEMQRQRFRCKLFRALQRDKSVTLVMLVWLSSSTSSVGINSNPLIPSSVSSLQYERSRRFRFKQLDSWWTFVTVVPERLRHSRVAMSFSPSMPWSATGHPMRQSDFKRLQPENWKLVVTPVLPRSNSSKVSIASNPLMPASVRERQKLRSSFLSVLNATDGTPIVQSSLTETIPPTMESTRVLQSRPVLLSRTFLLRGRQTPETPKM
jgi:hypothetical protein